jgi:hypothetical protein
MTEPLDYQSPTGQPAQRDGSTSSSSVVKAVVAGTAAGTFVALLGLAVVFLAVGAGWADSGNLLAVVIFPLPLAIGRVNDGLPIPAQVALAFLQFQAYGVTLGRLGDKGRLARVAALAAIGVAHMALLAACVSGLH